MCARDFKGVGNQYVEEGKLIIEMRDEKDTKVGSNWDGTQTAPTLTANNANGAQRMPDKKRKSQVRFLRDSTKTHRLSMRYP